MDMESLIIAYLEGRLSKQDQQQFESQLKDAPQLRRELEEWQLLLATIDNNPEKEPTLNMDFAPLFQKYPYSGPTNRSMLVNIRKFYVVAASITALLIVLGSALLWQQNKDLKTQITDLQIFINQQQQLLAASILQQASSSDKIKALNAVSPQKIEPELQKALLFALNYDDNVNVRLKAATALSLAMNDSALRQKMIASLAKQDQPEVQILLIELLSSYKEKDALPVLEALIQKHEVLKIVKDRAAYEIASLL